MKIYHLYIYIQYIYIYSIYIYQSYPNIKSPKSPKSPNPSPGGWFLVAAAAPRPSMDSMASPVMGLKAPRPAWQWGPDPQCMALNFHGENDDKEPWKFRLDHAFGWEMNFHDGPWDFEDVFRNKIEVGVNKKWQVGPFLTSKKSRYSPNNIRKTLGVWVFFELTTNLQSYEPN